MLVDTRMRWRVRIEIMRGVANPREMLGRMATQYSRILGGPWLTPFPIAMAIFQNGNGARDSSGPLGMPWRRVIDASRIVKDDHGRSLWCGGHGRWL